MLGSPSVWQRDEDYDKNVESSSKSSESTVAGNMEVSKGVHRTGFFWGGTKTLLDNKFEGF
jgi:hypothetical protein